MRFIRISWRPAVALGLVLSVLAGCGEQEPSTGRESPVAAEPRSAGPAEFPRLIGSEPLFESRGHGAPDSRRRRAGVLAWWSVQVPRTRTSSRRIFQQGPGSVSRSWPERRAWMRRPRWGASRSTGPTLAAGSCPFRAMRSKSLLRNDPWRKSSSPRRVRPRARSMWSETAPETSSGIPRCGSSGPLTVPQATDGWRGR